SFEYFGESLKYNLHALKIFASKELWNEINRIISDVYHLQRRFKRNIFRFISKYFLEFYQESIEVMKKIMYWNGIAIAYKNLARIFMIIGNYDSALSAYENAFEYFKIENNLRQMGLVYYYIGNFYKDHPSIVNYSEKATKYLSESAKYYELDNRIEEYYKPKVALSNFYSINGNLEAALQQFEEIFKYYRRRDNILQYYFSFRSLGDFHLYHGNYEKALEIYSEVINFFENEENWNELAVTYFTIAKLYANQDKYSEAIDYYKKSALNYRKSKALSNLALCNEKIGNMYSKLENVDLAIVHYDKRISLLDLENFIWDSYFKKLKIGDVYLNLGDFDKAMNFYNFILKEKIDGMEWDLSLVAHRRIGSILSLQENYDEALIHFKKALDYFSQMKQEENSNLIKVNVANTYMNLRRWGDAYNLFKEIIQYFRIHKPIVVDYYEIQCLRCQARLKENSGQIAEVASIYKTIAKINKKRDKLWYYLYYRYIYQLFKADLWSFKGKHKRSLYKLQHIKRSIVSLCENLSNSDKEQHLLKLIDFRIKQITLYINREKGFISEVENDYKKASEYLLKCADQAKTLITATYPLESRLYEGVSTHYLAHSVRLKWQDILEKSKMVLWDKDVIEDKIKGNFLLARQIFVDLSQDIREKYLNYEILLLEGKALEFINRDLARDKYIGAEFILNEINPEKVEEFHKYYAYLRPEYTGFPIEYLFLRKQPPGVSSPLLDETGYAEFINIEVDKSQVRGYVGEDYKIKVKVSFDKEFQRYIVKKEFFAFLVDSTQKQRFNIVNKLYHTFEFTLKGPKREKLKVFRVQILDKEEHVIHYKSFEQPYKERPTEFIGFLKAKFGSEPFDMILTYIKLGQFKHVTKNIDFIFRDFEKAGRNIEYHFNILVMAIESFKLNLDNDFVKLFKQFSEMRDFDVKHVAQKYKDNMKTLLNKYYFIKFPIILKFLKSVKENSNIQNYHPLILETQEYKIFNMYETEKWKEIPKETIKLFELIMQKWLMEKFNINSNKMNWETLPEEKVKTYKKLLAQIRGKPIEEIYLAYNLEFIPQMTLLMILDNDFYNYFNSNLSEINKVHERRNRETHGTIMGDNEDLSEICFNLINKLRNDYPAIYFKSHNVLQSQLSFIKDLINYIKSTFFIKKVEEEDILKKTVKVINQKIDNLGEDLSSIKEDTQTLGDLHNIVIEFTNEFIRVSKVMKNNIRFLIEGNSTKKLPKLLEPRYANKEDKNHLYASMKRLERVYVNIKNLLHIEKILVIPFQCENPDCNKIFRFVIFDKTKFFKTIQVLLKVGSISNNFLNLISQKNSEFTLWIQKNRHSFVKIEGDKLTLQAKITPEEAIFIYHNVLGIEDDNSKTLAETFNIYEEEDGTIHFHCKECFQQEKVPIPSEVS
ncbi:MAG: tetratricopeptide repeat protein, partial [Candidatus Thorarchaeota archaeon]